MKTLFRFVTAAVLGLMMSVAGAQALISNLGSVTDGDYGGAPDSADQVRTGAVSMNVTAVRVVWAGLGSTPGVNRVGFYTDNGGIPSTTQVGTFFTNPAVTTVGTITYTGSATLLPNTTYWMVVDIIDDSEVAYTFTNSVVVDPSTQGATMPPLSAYGDNVTGSWDGTDTADLKFEVIGTAGLTANQSVPVMPVAASALLALLMFGAARSRIQRKD